MYIYKSSNNRTLYARQSENREADPEKDFRRGTFQNPRGVDFFSSLAESNRFLFLALFLIFLGGGEGFYLSFLWVRN